MYAGYIAEELFVGEGPCSLSACVLILFAWNFLQGLLYHAVLSRTVQFDRNLLYVVWLSCLEGTPLH